jgi:superfamily II DNA/RNA helicase
MQTLALPKLLQGKPIALAAETGSGKTLAYLITCFQQALKRSSEQDKFPTALILVPARELVHQVHGMANELNQTLGVNVTMLNPNLVFSKYVPGIWITTPQIFKRNEDWFVEKILPNLSFVVFDEADRILSGSTLPIAKNLLLEIKKARKNGSDIIPYFIGATLPTNGKRTSGAIANYFTPDLEFVLSPEAHSAPKNTEQFFELVDDTKILHSKVLSILNSNRDLKKILIFVNTTNSATEMLDYLSKNSNCKLYGMSGEYDFDQRMGNLQKFNADAVKGDELQKVMVCTDLVSRGIDFKDVDIVIQAEFALNVVDYLHRIGRTGRFGKHGKAYNFFTTAHETLAHSIQKSHEEGETQAVHFSRGRLFSKKIKKAKRRQSEQQEDDSTSP